MSIYLLDTTLALALGCACLCHYFVEKPMLELEKKATLRAVMNNALA